MRKSTLFISAALTTFMLAVMFGVASAYQKIVQTATATEATQQQTQQQAQPANTMTSGTSSAVAGAMTIEQAADLASNVIGRTDLYAAENSQLNGVDAYLVTFSSGDLVYVGLDGKVLSISKMPVNYVTQITSSGGGGGGNNGGDNTSSVSAPAAPSAPVVTGGGEDHSNEDDPNNTEDHGNEDNSSEGEHDD